MFIVEQQVPPEIERDAADEEAHHLVAVDADGAVVGTGRLVVDGEAGVLGRLAVLPAARGRGLAKRLVQAIEDTARAAGCRVVELHAQVPVRGFYERLGYTAYGEEYDEAGIPHISMSKGLR